MLNISQLHSLHFHGDFYAVFYFFCSVASRIFQVPKYFDSGDYNVAKAKVGGKPGKPITVNQTIVMADGEVTGLFNFLFRFTEGVES